MRTKTTGIYRIRNNTNEHCYIGSSKYIEGRWYRHKTELKKNIHHSPYLQNAWNKYGEDAFHLDILEETDLDKDLLISREQHYLDTLKPEYNILPTAGSRLGSKASEETKAKMSASMKGKNTYKRTDETKAKLSAVASNPSEETRQKMRDAKIGKKASDGTKAKMSSSATGKAKSAEHIGKSVETRTKKRLAEMELKISQEPKKSLVKNDVRHTLRRFNANDVNTIRNSIVSDRQLGFQFGCSSTTISKIRNRETYKDV